MPEVIGLLAVWSIVISGGFLLLGVGLIRRGNVRWHHRAMLTATVFAGLFLVLYLAKWALAGTTRYAGPEEWRAAYYFVLLTHTLLAAVNGPLALVVLYNAFKGRFDRHKAWARWTVPVWLYVALSGWIIYAVLRLYGEKAEGIAF